MGAEITQRHNLVLSRIAHSARLLGIVPRVEPAGLHSDDRRRPDVQLDLPDVTLLGDVTISHPLAKSWQRVAASSARGVEAVGDAREAQKNALYADMAKECAMEFGAIVLYTYGGFHASALSFIGQMAKAADPATCLTSPTRWRRDLMEQMAVAVQRGTADIMIAAAQRMRGGAWVRRRRMQSVPRPSVPSRSWRRGRWGARVDGAASDSDDARRRLPDGGRAMACVAQLIGLSDSGDEAVDRGLSCRIVDSQADTEVEEEDEVGPAGSPLSSSSSPSFVAETPLSVSRSGGLSGGSERVHMAALLRREETEERAASVCAGGGGAVGDHRDAVRSECSIGAAPVVAAVAAAVVAGDGMEVEELEVADGMCVEMGECGGGGGGAGVGGVVGV